jgi:hypothetical protein
VPVPMALSVFPALSCTNFKVLRLTLTSFI